MEKKAKTKRRFLSAGAPIVVPIAAQALSDLVGKIFDGKRRKLRQIQIQR